MSPTVDEDCTSENPMTTTDNSGVQLQITGLKRERYNLEKHDMEIYGQVKTLQVGN